MAVNIIGRADAEAIARKQVISTILQDAPRQSMFMSMARRLPDMTSNQTRMRMLGLLPTAYWVDGDTGVKQTTRQAWDNVLIGAAGLAVIMPISEAVLGDAGFDIFGEITPRVDEAIGQRVGSAIIFGVSRPHNWQSDIITLARQVGNNVTVGSSPDYYNLLLGEGGIISKVKEDGCMATRALAAVSMRAKLRGIRATNGSLIFKSDMQGSTNYTLGGTPMYFPQNSTYDNTVTQLVVGDFKQTVYSIRQDMAVKILDQGVIQDSITKEIVCNLAQQDMVALRIVFRMGWVLPNPTTRVDGDRIDYPFAYLGPATIVTTQKVTFTVQDDTKTPVAISGVIVNVNGSRVKTGASGAAEFNLQVETYLTKIKKSGYGQVTGIVTIVDVTVAKDVTLIKR